MSMWDEIVSRGSERAGGAKSRAAVSPQARYKRPVAQGARRVKPGPKPGPAMPCGWCGYPMRGCREVRQHFLDCPKRPGGPSKRAKYIRTYGKNDN